MKDALIEVIKKEKLVVIVRGVADDELEPLLEAMYAGGIRLAEITFDSKGVVTAQQTANQISKMKAAFKGRMHIGAGTVVTKQQAKIAVKAGAEFLISPNVNVDVIKYAAKKGVVSMPGALTPTEAVTAYNAGADFVKVFPSDSMGAPYIKAISAPLSHIPFIAVGGVDDANLCDFLKAGACGVGVGSNIVNKTMLKEKRFDDITALAKRYCDAVASFNK